MFIVFSTSNAHVLANRSGDYKPGFVQQIGFWAESI
jgi:hypothetical protein